MEIRRASRLLVVVTAFVTLISTWAHADDLKDAKKALAVEMEKIYPLSQLNFKMTDVKTTGCVVVLQKDGIIGGPAQTTGDAIDVLFTATPTSKMLSNGEMRHSGGGPTARTFKKGDRFYVWDIKPVGSTMVVKLISVDSYEFSNAGGTPWQSRYNANIEWTFDKEAWKSAQASELKKNFDEVFKLESEANAVQTKNVELGQTLEQVEAALGKPGKVINLGSKTIYVYPDIKVVFVEGKVSDVE